MHADEMNSPTLFACDGSGRINLEITRADAESGSHSGDCEADVRALMQEPYIQVQVEAWPIEDLRANLREYGAWDDDELADEDMCRVRTLWLLCGDAVENAREAE